MERDVELLTVGPETADHDRWAGPRRRVDHDARALASALASSQARAVLCLGGDLPLPSRELLDRLLAGPADAWHAGLRLGLGHQPAAFDHVNPLWMLNTPLEPECEATSWRVSLRALLVRSEVVHQLGGPDDGFRTLSGSGLDLGLGWIRAGALVRHVPDLVVGDPAPDDRPPPEDGLRLVARHHGRAWAAWAWQRALVTREVGPVASLGLLRPVRRVGRAPLPDYVAPRRPSGRTDRRVSVVVPTVDRYPYLLPLLGQLAEQTVPPHEVLVIDQTPAERRRSDLVGVAPGLPLQVVEIERPGQSTARNAALARATGEVALFLDDDLDISSMLIQQHLEALAPGIDAVSGGVDDATAGPPPPGFRHRRASDVLPGGNTVVTIEALRRSGLFDPAYDHGPRADHDLGTRLLLAGALVVYDPSVEVYHHHAPSGGLRTHGARKVTRASARRSLTESHLPASTQLYLARRYFTDRQRREARAITLVSLLSGEGPPARRLARAAVQLARLPRSRRAFARADREAAVAVASRPDIPVLDSRTPPTMEPDR